MVQVVTGRYHSLAVASDGKIFTWGLNDFGQLGRPVALADGSSCTSGPQCADGTPRAVESFTGGALCCGARCCMLSLPGSVVAPSGMS